MSSGTAWLNKQKKPELTALAKEANLPDYADLLVPELKESLDKYLRAHQRSLGKNASFADFYKGVTATSQPAKAIKEIKEIANDVKNTALTTIEAKTPKSVKKTVAKVAAAIEDEDTLVGALATPRKSLADVMSVIPASPAVITRQIERQTNRVSAQFQTLYYNLGIDTAIEEYRDRISTTAIEVFALFIELYGLSKSLFPLADYAVVPAYKNFGTSEWPVKVPDLFAMLKPNFWAVLFMWLSASLFVPLLVSYFFNFTLKSRHSGLKTRHRDDAVSVHDPLVFNITKAVTFYLVFVQHTGLSYGWTKTAMEINAAIPGGYNTVLTASAIGAITSIYEAILSK